MNHYCDLIEEMEGLKHLNEKALFIYSGKVNYCERRMNIPDDGSDVSSIFDPEDQDLLMKLQSKTRSDNVMSLSRSQHQQFNLS